MLPGGAGCPRSTPHSETTLGSLAFTVAESVTERDEVDGNTDTLANCAHTAPVCGHASSTLRWHSVVFSETCGDMSTHVQQEADGNTGALNHCVRTANPYGMGALAFAMDSTVAMEKSCVLGTPACESIVTVHRLNRKVASTDLSTISYSVVESVAASRVAAADGSARDLAHCASTTLICKTLILDNAVASTLPACASTTRSCSLGASTLDLAEVGATDSTALPSSVLFCQRVTLQMAMHMLSLVLRALLLRLALVRRRWVRQFWT